MRVTSLNVNISSTRADVKFLEADTVVLGLASKTNRNLRNRRIFVNRKSVVLSKKAPMVCSFLTEKEFACEAMGVRSRRNATIVRGIAVACEGDTVVISPSGPY